MLAAEQLALCKWQVAQAQAQISALRAELYREELAHAETRDALNALKRGATVRGGPVLASLTTNMNPDVDMATLAIAEASALAAASEHLAKERLCEAAQARAERGRLEARCKRLEYELRHANGLQQVQKSPSLPTFRPVQLGVRELQDHLLKLVDQPMATLSSEAWSVGSGSGSGAGGRSSRSRTVKRDNMGHRLTPTHVPRSPGARLTPLQAHRVHSADGHRRHHGSDRSTYSVSESATSRPSSKVGMTEFVTIGSRIHPPDRPGEGLLG